jgi:hypothetical protein
LKDRHTYKRERVEKRKRKKERERVKEREREKESERKERERERKKERRNIKKRNTCFSLCQKTRNRIQFLVAVDPHVLRLPRAREVGQSWLSSAVTTFKASIFAFALVYKHRPQLLVNTK